MTVTLTHEQVARARELIAELAVTLTVEQPTDIGGASDLLTIEDVVRKLNISRWSVYRLLNDNRIASVKIGSRRLVAATEIDRFIRATEALGVSR